MKKKNNNVLKFLIVSGFILAYLLPLSVLLSDFSITPQWFLKLFAVLAFINTFVQIMLGGFRPFFRKNFNPVIVYKLHNYLGIITLVLALIHGLAKAQVMGLVSTLLFDKSLNVSLGVLALYVMGVTVISSDAYYIFKIRYNNTLWRLIHLLNYALFFLIFLHASNLGVYFQNPLIKYTSYVFIVFVAGTVFYRIYSVLKK